MSSMRIRVAVLVVATVALALTVVGVTVVGSFASRERRALDTRLGERRPQQVATALRRALARGQTTLPQVLRQPGDFARVTRSGRVVLSAGTPPSALPSGPGLRTTGDVRVLTRRLPSGALVQTGAATEPTDSRIASLRSRVLALSVAGVALAGLAAWWLAGLALGPLRRVREGAERVSTTRDLASRLPEGGGVEEVDSLAASVNAMLARLERSAAQTEHALAATRRFAADAGHEMRTPLTALRADLATLARNPGMPAPDRRAVLEEAEAEAERAARLLGALQLLARGEAGASLPREPVDLDALLDVALERAARRHPRTSFRRRTDEPAAGAQTGWPDGLASLVDNLLDNAALHGSAGGAVTVGLNGAGGRPLLTVDDDGPGVPETDRERMFGRFERGASARSGGSGLGLALVRQQARLHGGDAWIESAPGGGARVRVELAARDT